jgi:hypothetical protein
MIREEQEEDRLASQALLPEPGGRWQWSQRFVATDSRNRIIAAAGLWRGPDRHRCDFRAAEATDPVDGVGPLWQAVRQQALARNADLVVGLRPLEFDSAEASIWLDLGFERDAVKITHESGYGQYFDELDRTLSRLTERGRVPAAARVVGLREAPSDQVVSLLVEGIGMSRPVAALMLSGGGPQRIHPALSCVAMCGDLVVALNLASRISDSTARLDSVVVKPGWRKGWANVWVKHEGARRAIASGKTRIIAETGDEHGDSRRQARRNGSVVLRKTFLPVYWINKEDALRG